MVLDFRSTIDVLENWGVADVLLPFLLVFAIVFAVLEKTRIFGQDKKNINIIIALVVGLSVVIPHVLNSYPSGVDVVDMINTILPQASLIAVTFVMLLLLVGIFGGEWIGKSISGWMALISAIAILIIFGGAAGWWDSWYWFYDYFGDEAVSVAVMILVFGLIIWFITKEEKKGPGESMFDWLEKAGNFLKGR